MKLVKSGKPTEKPKVKRVQVFRLEKANTGKDTKSYNEILVGEGEFLNYRTSFGKFNSEIIMMILAVIKLDKGTILTTPATMINFIDEEEPITKG